MGETGPCSDVQALSVAVHEWKVPFEGGHHIFITSTIVWPQVNNREGTQLHPSTENWIKDLLSTTLPIRTKGSSIHEIFQARILDWVAISFSRASSQPRV